jgi:hypothetical protein
VVKYGVYVLWFNMFQNVHAADQLRRNRWVSIFFYAGIIRLVCKVALSLYCVIKTEPATTPVVKQMVYF